MFYNIQFSKIHGQINMHETCFSVHFEITDKKISKDKNSGNTNMTNAP